MKDHCFLFDAPDGVQGMAFCAAAGISRADARSRVGRVLEQEKGLTGARVAYLGVLDHHDMDEEVGPRLSWFERFDPVWLWLRP